MSIQGTAPGVLSGIVKGFKGGKVSQNADLYVAKTNFTHLEDIFLRSPFPDPSSTVTDNPEAVELNLGSLSLSLSPNRSPSALKFLFFYSSSQHTSLWYR